MATPQYRVGRPLARLIVAANPHGNDRAMAGQAKSGLLIGEALEQHPGHGEHARSAFVDHLEGLSPWFPSSLQLCAGAPPGTGAFTPTPKGSVSLVAPVAAVSARLPRRR